MSRAPWDEVQFFQPLTLTSTSIGASSVVQLIGFNSSRVALILSTGVAAGSIFFVPQTPAGIATPFIPAGNSIPPLIFTQKDHGILCQSAWFAQNTSAGAIRVSAIEVLISIWPKDQPDGDTSRWQQLAEILGLKRHEG